MSKLIKTPLEGISHDKWLELRRESIGGSDAAAIIGLNPYSSPFYVWCDKTGRLPERDDNEAMRQGRDLEAYVAERWMESTGKKVRRDNHLIKNPDYPFAHANIDRWVIGENAGLECKTTSVMNLKHFKDGEYPAQYYVQCVHYMAVTGADKWYLAVLVLNQGFYTFTIERDNAEIETLMNREREFWQYVTDNTPPPPDGTQATETALELIYSDSTGGDSVDLFGRDSLFEDYARQLEIKKAAEKEIDRIKQTIMLDMGENETAHCGSYKVSWKTQSRSTFDVKKYAADNPGADLSAYYTETKFRRFNITNKGDKKNG